MRVYSYFCEFTRTFASLLVFLQVYSYFCEFTRIFARILLVFLFKKCSYFARIFKKMSSYEELDTLTLLTPITASLATTMAYFAPITAYFTINNDKVELQVSTGTTLVAVEFEGGVVIGADSRTSMVRHPSIPLTSLRNTSIFDRFLPLWFP